MSKKNKNIPCNNSLLESSLVGFWQKKGIRAAQLHIRYTYLGCSNHIGYFFNNNNKERRSRIKEITMHLSKIYAYPNFSGVYCVTQWAWNRVYTQLTHCVKNGVFTLASAILFNLTNSLLKLVQSIKPICKPDKLLSFLMHFGIDGWLLFQNRNNRLGKSNSDSDFTFFVLTTGVYAKLDG